MECHQGRFIEVTMMALEFHRLTLSEYERARR